MADLVAQPGRHLLLVDTCGAAGSIDLAALEPAASIVGEAELPGRSASERLLPAVQELLAEHGAGFDSLAAIAVVHGPGSFTGIRVGVSAAKGLAEALAIPLMAISRLAVLAARSGASEAFALLNAGRGELYCGHYREAQCVSEALLGPEDLLALLQAHPSARLVACEPALGYLLASHAVTFVAEPTAAAALPIARERLRAGHFDSAVTLDANYVRRTGLFAKSAVR